MHILLKGVATSAIFEFLLQNCHLFSVFKLLSVEMSVAATRLEILQVRKLIQCVRDADTTQISKIVELGVPNIVNYQGSYNLSLPYVICTNCLYKI